MKTFTAAAVASSALLSLASAQSAGTYQINPDSVSSSDRQYWCNSQITQCPVSAVTWSPIRIRLTRVTVDLPATTFRDCHPE